MYAVDYVWVWTAGGLCFQPTVQKHMRICGNWKLSEAKLPVGAMTRVRATFYDILTLISFSKITLL